jgi:hypothetical protein
MGFWFAAFKAGRGTRSARRSRVGGRAGSASDRGGAGAVREAKANAQALAEA